MAKSKTKSTPPVEAFGNRWTGVVTGTEAEVRAIEVALDFAVPKELADLLRTCGSGKPERGFFFSKRHDTEVIIGHIFPLQDQPKKPGVVTAATVRRRVTSLPAHFVPFAMDNGNSDVICIDTNTAAVVWWLHDEPDGERGRTVASSLEELITGLTTPPY